MSRDVDQGWAWIVMVASFLNLVCLGIMIFGAGIIYMVLLESFNEDAVKTAWIGSMCGSLSAIVGPIAGLLTTNFSCRVSIMTGGLLVCVGLGSSAYVDDLNLLFITFGLLGGCGLGLMYTPCMVVLGYYFEDKRDIACGIAVMGTAIGSMVAPAAIRGISDTYGWRGMFLILGGIEFHIFLFGVISKPSSVEIRQNRTYHDMQCQKRVRFSLLDQFRVLKNLSLFLLNISIFLWGISCSSVILHLPKYAITQGASEQEVFYMMIVFGAGSITSRFLAGIGSGMGETYKFILYFGSFGVMSIIVMAFPLFSETATGRLVFIGLFGFYTSVCYGVLNQITVELVGLQDLAVAFGMEMLINGIGFLIGPPIAAQILKATTTYTASFIFSGVTMLLSAIAGMLMMIFKKPLTTIDVQMNARTDLSSVTSLRGVVGSSVDNIRHRSFLSLKSRGSGNGSMDNIAEQIMLDANPKAEHRHYCEIDSELRGSMGEDFS